MRKAVSARTTKKHLTKAEKEKRMAVENAFTDDAVIEPPSYLTKTQLEAFNFIVDALSQSIKPFGYTNNYSSVRSSGYAEHIK